MRTDFGIASPPVRVVTTPAVVLLWVLCGSATPILGQEVGHVVGTVLSAGDGSPVAQATVSVEATGRQALTADDGTFIIRGVPAGVRWIRIADYFHGGQRVRVEIPAGDTVSVSIEYQPIPFDIEGVLVIGASRVPQRVVDAPVAIDVADRVEARNYSSTGQHPLVIKGLAGMDVAPNGVHDFNVNTRGFNADLANRLLVLMDGRDLSIPFLGAQEWSALTLPLEDIERIEVVRGPGSALYGANAYNGVVNIITPPARAIVGTKVSLAGGGLGTLRGDLRTAHVLGRDGRIGVRANVGYYRSRDWHRSRTNLGDLEREYRPVVGETDPINTPDPGFEVRPLNGQSVAGVPGPATGEIAPIQNYYGSARVDYYASGGIGTVESGAAKATNQLFMTNVGRFQVDHAWRPWARAAWTADRFHLMGWYSGRSSDQTSLASGQPIKEDSRLLHFEGQFNQHGFGDRARFVAGGSYRSSFIDSRATLVPPQDDARTDWYLAGFAQVEMELSPRLRLVGAGRVDGSNLFDTQLSPKAAVIFRPAPEHSFRVSVGAAFQTPRMTNFFLRVPLGVPLDLAPLEAGLREAFGSVLDPVPQGELFTRSSSVPALALGNSDLDVERVVSYEVGYRGEWSERIQLTVDGFYSVVRDFVSALLPGANSFYADWTAPETLDPSVRVQVETAVRNALGPASGLSRLDDAARSTAVVFSYGNAGRATEWGLELGASVEVSPGLRIDGTYSYFDYRVDSGVPTVPGDLIVPNTPTHKGGLQVHYVGGRLDAWSGLDFKTGHQWVSGPFRGRVSASQRIDAGAGYILGDRIRIHVTGTNIFDQSVFHIYGGSIDRRRILFGLTAYMQP